MQEENKEPIKAMLDLVEKNAKKVISEKKLAFDPIDGSLIVTENPKRGDVVVDQIYQDGFFSQRA